MLDAPAQMNAIGQQISQMEQNPARMDPIRYQNLARSATSLLWERCEDPEVRQVCLRYPCLMEILENVIVETAHFRGEMRWHGDVASLKSWRRPKSKFA